MNTVLRQADQIRPVANRIGSEDEAIATARRLAAQIEPCLFERCQSCPELRIVISARPELLLGLGQLGLSTGDGRL